MMGTKLKSEINVRWTIRRDMPSILGIESDCFEHPWTEEEFLKALRSSNCIGMSAEVGKKDEFAGYMIYNLHRKRLELLRLAVAPSYHRCGVGTEMLNVLKGKLSSDRRNTISILIRESNLSAQLFFKSQGFVAVEVLRKHYDETGEDAYEMEYRF